MAPPCSLLHPHFPERESQNVSPARHISRLSPAYTPTSPALFSCPGTLDVGGIRVSRSLEGVCLTAPLIPGTGRYHTTRMSSRKQTLRARARSTRDAIPAPKRAELSNAIREHLLSFLDGADPVLVYASKPPEVDTGALIEEMISRGTRVVVPIIEKERRNLRLSYLRNSSLLSTSTFSVPEPIGHEIPADPKEINVVIVPMIAFDSAGHRLGYGAGYYDRFLLPESPYEKRSGWHSPARRWTPFPPTRMTSAWISW